MTAPHTDRYERRLFPPEQSLANDKIDRPTIYYTETKRRSFAAMKQTSPFFEIACVLVRLDHAARFRYRRAALFFLGAAFPFPGRHFSKTTREEARV